MNHQAPLYVIDFDRTLGSVDGMTRLLCRVISDITDDEGLVRDLKSTLRAASESGLSFDAYGYLSSRVPKSTVAKIMERFVTFGAQDVEVLREEGATAFLDWIDRHGFTYCIMSYGAADWQTTKVRAAGFDDTKLLVVDSPDKVAVIRTWKNENGEYDVLRSGRRFVEIVLIDDKAQAFNHIGESIRGYHVAKEPLLASQAGIVAPRVRRMLNIKEVIDAEDLIHESR